MKSRTPKTLEEYARAIPGLNALAQEVHFILDQALSEAGIKIHAIEYRVKEFDSIARKFESKSDGEDTEINDLVGARVICLFKSDLERIDEVIRSEFTVDNVDDKIVSSSDTFGYMSVHYISKLKSGVSGRRYDAIKDRRFEIQVRTLCMHAWAAISHYLEYKSEWDIPDHLKKGLNALSGLFYVADAQYEQLYNARQGSREQANREVSSGASKPPINLDTLQAYLIDRFANRPNDKTDTVSNLVSELKEAGIDNFSEIDSLIDAGREMLESEEKKHLAKPENQGRDVFYTRAGAVRCSLRGASEKYKEVWRKRQAAARQEKAKVKPS
jgi:ppGpp synthetase/RelA/SpoT-type nucleotidyltranferase